jgi:steroid Delta-isomerase
MVKMKWGPVGSLGAMVTPEHVEQVVKTYCLAESAKDRDTWLSLFAPDAVHEDPVGAPVNRGVEAIGAFFDAGAGQMDLDLHATAAPIVVGDEALVFLEVHVGHGSERLVLAPIVDHMVFDGEGRIASLRAFFDPAGIAPDPE